MVEYGQTVGQGSGGGVGGGGGSVELGGDIAALLSNAVDRVASLPPEVLLLLAVVILGGILVLRRGL